MVRDKIYFGGILLLVIGLSFSRAFVSISYVILIANWLFDKRVFQKFGQFFSNRAAWIFTSIYLMHLVGLLYSTDLSHGWLDIRTKIPLLILPLIFSTMPRLSKRDFIIVILIFSLSVVATWGTSLFHFFVDNPTDFRESFVFNSHIRLSIMAVIAFYFFLWLAIYDRFHLPKWIKIAFVFFAIFLIFSVVLLEVMSGLVLFLISVAIFSIYFILKGRGRLVQVLMLLLPLLLIGVGFYSYKTINDYRTVDEEVNMEQKTKYGNVYLNLEHQFPIENGSSIGRQICWEEMKMGWNKRSSLDFDSSMINGYPLKFTLLRYLNSKGLSKDLEGVKQLSLEDISFVEQGFANVEYTRKFSFKKRIYKLLWEYDMYSLGGDLNASSVIKRFYLWQTGVNLVKQNPIFGIGNGDVKKAFAQELIHQKSPLANSGLRTHNQWVSLAIAFGLVGFAWFVFAFYYPVFYRRQFDFLFMVVLLVYSMSMFWEDSLETQIGVTIIAFFYPFLMFQNPFVKE